MIAMTTSNSIKVKPSSVDGWVVRLGLPAGFRWFFSRFIISRHVCFFKWRCNACCFPMGCPRFKDAATLGHCGVAAKLRTPVLRDVSAVCVCDDYGTVTVVLRHGWSARFLRMLPAAGPADPAAVGIVGLALGCFFRRLSMPFRAHLQKQGLPVCTSSFKPPFISRKIVRAT